MSKNIYSFSFVIFFFNIKNVSSAIVLFYISEPLYVVWPFYKYLCKALTIHTQIQILYFTVTARYLQIHCNSCTTLQHVTFISRDYWTVKSYAFDHISSPVDFTDIVQLQEGIKVLPSKSFWVLVSMGLTCSNSRTF